ncbi:MAG TPA: hypothetical protein VMB79_09830 [Jatrophihabitans sp.]|nr:hypothetical protein [Jatrophihabitans sp.]
MPDPTTPPAPAEPSAGAGTAPAALTEFRRRTARANRIYAVVLAAIVLAAFVGVRLAYAHGELDKVSFRTGAPASPVQGSTPATSLRRAWQVPDTAAGGDPYDSGVVVTYSGHTVNGRDAVTGAVRWHYTRSDELLCSVVQQDASTIAIYRRKGNCDEVTGFTTATGQPKWYRTLTDDGNTSAASTSNVVLTVNAHLVHAFDNAGGLDRWDWTAPDGCAVRQALAGSMGVLIALDCAGAHRLVLHDLIADTVKWTVDTPTTVVPIAADAFVGTVDPATGTVYRYTPDKGAASASAQLGGPVSVLGGGSSGGTLARSGVSATDAAGQLVQFVSFTAGAGTGSVGTGSAGAGSAGTGAAGAGGSVAAGPGALAAFASDGSLRWRVAASGPAWPVSTAFVGSLAGPGALVVRRIETGRTQLSSSLAPPAAGTEQVYPVGSGVLLAGAGVSLYR